MSHKKADLQWDATNETDIVPTWERVLVVLLQDVREELKEIKYRLAFGTCPDFRGMPDTLRSIRRNTAQPRPPRASPPRPIGFAPIRPIVTSRTKKKGKK